MVIDTSAILAILLDEPERVSFVDKIESDAVRLMSAVSFVETGILIEARFRDAGARDVDGFVHRAGIEIVPVDREQAEIACRAWRRFGKGQHPAALNLGDGFAYALVKTTGEPLLFKGADFARTDVAAC